MKITKVEAITLSVPIKDKIKAPISIPYADELEKLVFGEYRATLVKVETDTGITGWGECMVRFAPTATRDIVNYISPILIGKDPFDTEMLWELMFGSMMNRGHYQGFFVEALSGIDCALWDIKGKALQVPVYKLLGAGEKPSFMAYASSIRFRGLPAVKETAQRFKENGFRAMKIKIGQDPDTDMMTVRAVRQVVGADIELTVDANCGYDAKTALRVGKVLEECNIRWFEEPVRPDDFDGYRLLSEHLSVPIAGGEAHFLRWGQKDLITRGKIDIVQPNICRAGGVTECIKIHGLASSYNVRYLTHTGSCSAVCLASTLHIAAAFADCYTFEHMQADWSKDQRNPLRWDLTPLPMDFDPETGIIFMQEKPGFGLEINEAVIAEHRVDRPDGR